MQEYSVKYTKLSKYSPSLVSNPRDEMSRFIMGVFDDLVEECCLAMIHVKMHISMLMVHAQQFEETRLKRKNKEFIRDKSYEGGTSKSSLEIQEKSRFKKRVSNQVPSNFSKAIKDIHLSRNLLVPGVVRSIGVSV